MVTNDAHDNKISGVMIKQKKNWPFLVMKVKSTKSSNQNDF